MNLVWIALAAVAGYVLGCVLQRRRDRQQLGQHLDSIPTMGIESSSP